MNANLFFLIFACCLFSISVITITIAPIVSKAQTSFFDGWGTTNCQILEDDLDFVRLVLQRCLNNDDAKKYIACAIGKLINREYFEKGRKR